MYCWVSISKVNEQEVDELQGEFGLDSQVLAGSTTTVTTCILTTSITADQPCQSGAGMLAASASSQDHEASANSRWCQAEGTCLATRALYSVHHSRRLQGHFSRRIWMMCVIVVATSYLAGYRCWYPRENVRRHNFC
jgi:hypothetical protein